MCALDWLGKDAGEAEASHTYVLPSDMFAAMRRICCPDYSTIRDEMVRKSQLGHDRKFLWEFRQYAAKAGSAKLPMAPWVTQWPPTANQAANRDTQKLL
ncbi:hypothetical protein EV286_107428 [Rhizobium sp. BK251]|nr:hypothetical protein EV286_107428 [Rhizobium sp. BK251]